MIIARQSTARTVTVGPVLDADGVAVTGGVVADFKISKNGGAPAALNGSATLTHRHTGFYSLALTASDLDTVGQAEVTIDDTVNACPMKELSVIEEAVYDALYAASATGMLPANVIQLLGTAWLAPAVAGTPDVNAKQLGGSTQSATDLKDFADTGYDPATHKVEETKVLTGLTVEASTTLKTGSHNPQSGDAYARLGAPAGASHAADIASIKTDATTLLTRLSAARAGYLDNLNVAGIVATQADVNAINQSASRRVILTTVGQYERPESGNTVYTVEARTYSDDGDPMNATGTPTLTATGQTSGDLSANLSAASNPATGVYRWTYTLASAATLEPVRMDFAGTVDGDSLTMSVHTQIADFVAATFTTADRTKLDAMHAKLPSKAFLTGTVNADGDVQLDEATGSANINPDQDWTGVYAVNSTGQILKDVDASVGASGVVVQTNNDKTGYRLSATGVDDVWDEALAGHATAGTAGKALSDAGSGGSAPTSDQNAVAVWDKLAAAHNTAGTMGAKLNAAGAAADPLASAVPGAYAAGTAGYKLGLIGTAGSTVPVDSLIAGEINIVVGDDYNSALLNPKEFTASGFPNSAGATCWFGVGPLDGAYIILDEGTITGSGTVTATFQLTKAQTALLTPDTTYGYSWQIENASGERVGGRGECHALRKWDD
jgi:hypothetical protein